MKHPLAIYIHIPFCAVRCHYCDFNTFSGLETFFESYMAALEQEIRQAGQIRNRPAARTIFVGGGTPTVVPPELLGRVLDACQESFELSPDAEITCEANPGTVDQARFAALRAMGVNRLSMGVQSFDDEDLRWLGRMHNAHEAVGALAAAREAGFDNINLDFMFGLPGQKPAAWQRTLEQAIALHTEHLSLYSLIVEPGTPLHDWVARGTVASPDDDLAADLYIAAQATLADNGYRHYEISNWALGESGTPGESLAYACRHNLVYWRDEPYLGFGAGAHSYEGNQRRWNVRPVPQYIQRIRQGQPTQAGSETIEHRLEMGEVMMLGLRLLIEGVSVARFRGRFGLDLGEAFGPEIHRLASRGMIEYLPDRLRLTPAGRLLGNQVFAAFLPEEP